MHPYRNLIYLGFIEIETVVFVLALLYDFRPTKDDMGVGYMILDALPGVPVKDMWANVMAHNTSHAIDQSNTYASSSADSPFQS